MRLMDIDALADQSERTAVEARTLRPTAQPASCNPCRNAAATQPLIRSPRGVG
jgi:hypothetical protein